MTNLFFSPQRRPFQVQFGTLSKQQAQCFAVQDRELYAAAERERLVLYQNPTGVLEKLEEHTKALQTLTQTLEALLNPLASFSTQGLPEMLKKLCNPKMLAQVAPPFEASLVSTKASKPDWLSKLANEAFTAFKKSSPGQVSGAPTAFRDQLTAQTRGIRDRVHEILSLESNLIEIYDAIFADAVESRDRELEHHPQSVEAIGLSWRGQLDRLLGIIQDLETKHIPVDSEQKRHWKTTLRQIKGGLQRMQKLNIDDLDFSVKDTGLTQLSDARKRAIKQLQKRVAALQQYHQSIKPSSSQEESQQWDAREKELVRLQDTSSLPNVHEELCELEHGVETTAERWRREMDSLKATLVKLPTYQLPNEVLQEIFSTQKRYWNSDAQFLDEDYDYSG